MQTLVIDTSYGSTVGMVGHDPIVETDSRTHVEKLQVNIATTVEQAGLKPENIDRIIVGIGPAPFTGLRAGIVAAKALAFATGARCRPLAVPGADLQGVHELRTLDDAIAVQAALGRSRRACVIGGGCRRFATSSSRRCNWRATVALPMSPPR